jgi:hypothetical protein
MRTLIILSLAVAGLTLGACSKSDSAKLETDARQIAADTKTAVHNTANDPQVKKAGDELKDAAGKAKEGVVEAGHDLKDAGQKAGDSAKDAAQDAKEATKK